MAAGTDIRSGAAIAFPLHAPPQQVHAYMRAMGCLMLLVEAADSSGGKGDSGSNGAGSRGVDNWSALAWASVDLERLSTAGCVSGGHVVCMRDRDKSMHDVLHRQSPCSKCSNLASHAQHAGERCSQQGHLPSMERTAQQSAAYAWRRP